MARPCITLLHESASYSGCALPHSEHDTGPVNAVLMMRRELLLFWILALLSFGASPSPALGQGGLGFRTTLGFEEVGGDYGEVLDGHVVGEFDILYGFRRVRLGGGFSWVSFDMDPPYQDDTWSSVQAHAIVAYPFSLGSRLRAYLEGRLTHRRLKPEGDLFPPVETEEGGHAPAFRVSGTGGEARFGIEVPIVGSMALDLSGHLSVFATDDADLAEINGGIVNSGSTWGIHVGIVWFP